MPTLTEPTTANLLVSPVPPMLQTTLPAVTYDQEHFQITAYLIVSACTSDPDGLSVQAPMIAVPQSAPDSPPWTVLWKVVPGSGLISASFDPDLGKAQIPDPDSKPNSVTIDLLITSDPNQFAIKLLNLDTTAASFKYLVHVCGTASDSNNITHLKKTHDPTIVVTMEPMG
jgi:hypothetical protein